MTYGVNPSIENNKAGSNYCGYSKDFPFVEQCS